MDEEEPAWRAELREALDERFPYVRNAVTRDAIREFVTEQIEAAEQRGRQEALREAANEFMGLRPLIFNCAEVAALIRGFADPAKAESP